MSVQNILFVSHPQSQCGVYQFGLNVSAALSKSSRYNFCYAECSKPQDLRAELKRLRPAAVIYNYYFSTLPWLSEAITKSQTIPQIQVLHEVTQEIADRASDGLFDYHIAPDPTLLLNNPRVFKTGRLIPTYAGASALPSKPTIGCFGFGTYGKGFERIIAEVQKDYDEAVIRLHLPSATFADADGKAAATIAQRCRDLITSPGVVLQVNHAFLAEDQLLDFLAANTLNAFLYTQTDGRGISSAVDYALAVRRPIALSRSSMFRHMFDARPSIFVEDASLREIAANGNEPLRPFQEEWTETNLIWDYERIVARILEQPLPPRPKRSLLGRALRKLRRRFVPSAHSVQSTVVDKQMRAPEAIPAASGQVKPVNGYSYRPIAEVAPYNRILDDASRALYAPAIKALSDLVPDLIARKIERANIQQAFVFDTVIRFAAARPNNKVLCVGGYEDSAAASLKATGLRMEDIDPATNYDLATFLTKPSTMRASYDIVFSTSVIEHVYDDERFVTQIAELLAPGGVGILTCDYNDQYRPGDPIPQEDHRFYTQKDFTERLLPRMEGCEFIDDPQWDCPEPDFTYGGCKYTFATFVVRKATA